MTSALMLTGVVTGILVVVIVNVALLSPAGTVTVPGTVASAEPEDSATTEPPVGALPLSLTVPVVESPPSIGLVANSTSEAIGGSMVRMNDLVAPPPTPVIVA